MYQRCAKRGEAQVHELIDEFTSFKDSYEDMNFTPPLLGTIKARTLIVQGDRDPFFPVTIATEMYQAIPGSALWIVPRGGHVPIFGPRQQEFETIASEFLQSGGKTSLEYISHGSLRLHRSNQRAPGAAMRPADALRPTGTSF